MRCVAYYFLGETLKNPFPLHYSALLDLCPIVHVVVVLVARVSFKIFGSSADKIFEFYGSQYNTFFVTICEEHIFSIFVKNLPCHKARLLKC